MFLGRLRHQKQIYSNRVSIRAMPVMFPVILSILFIMFDAAVNRNVLICFEDTHFLGIRYVEDLRET